LLERSSLVAATARRRKVAFGLLGGGRRWWPGLLAGLLVLAPAPAAQATAASVSVLPTSGDPGVGLTVSGSGWVANDVIQVRIGGSSVCSLTADSGGSISSSASTPCQVPSGIPHGSQPLTALDVTDGTTGATGASFTITPFASFTAPSSVAVGTSGNFDGSGSQGAITHYLWNFGDGSTDSTTGANPSHSYSKVGSYTVTLTVVDNSGNIDASSQLVSVTGTAPSASFNPPAEAPTGTALNFDGSGSSHPNTGSTITSYDWSWGDGTPDGSGATPTHSYTKARAYQVTLTVSDSAGQTSSPTSHTTTVDDRPPAAAFDPVSATILTSTPLAFDGALSSDPDGTIASYSWDFGDGSSSTDAQPSHSYANAGTYTVKLTVTDNSGNTAVVSHQITVNAPPGLVIATVVNPPSVISSGSPSTTASRAVDLGQRLFCAGIGPSCQAYITATSSALARDARAARRGSARHGKPTAPPKPTTSPAGIATLTTAQNGSVELTFKLSKAALASLRKHGRLPLKVTILAVRGTQRTSSTLSLTLKLPAKRKG
jgi:PKD repeat protein